MSLMRFGFSRSKRVTDEIADGDTEQRKFRKSVVENADDGTDGPKDRKLLCNSVVFYNLLIFMN